MITVPLLHPRKTYCHTPLESTFTLRCHLRVQSRQMFAQEPMVCHSHRTLLNGVHASYRLLREEYAMDTGDMCSLRRRYEITSHYATACCCPVVINVEGIASRIQNLIYQYELVLNDSYHHVCFSQSKSFL